MECLCKESRSVCVPLIGSIGLCFAVLLPAAELLSLMIQTNTAIVSSVFCLRSYKVFESVVITAPIHNTYQREKPLKLIIVKV
jgi:hypothetical protein